MERTLELYHHIVLRSMKRNKITGMWRRLAAGLSVSALFCGAGAAMTLEEVIGRLENARSFAATAEYAVTLPQAQDDIVYKVDLLSDKADGDSLCEADYLIRWELPTPSGLSEGFLGYFDGHHYRFRDRRLQEYHYEWDSVPFITAGGGVQRNGQFVDLLPQEIGALLRRMSADSLVSLSFTPDTVVGGERMIGVTAVRSVRGYTGLIMRLLLDSRSGMPVLIDNEFNPGQISEQLVVVRYAYPSEVAAETVPVSEEALVARFPDVFEKYRESNYSIESLRGGPVPGFSLPTPAGERYTRAKGDSFAAPTVIALIDPAAGFARETVDALREAAARSPKAVNLVMAFVSSNADRIEELTGGLAPGEAVLMSARSLARDCGATAFPAIIVADEEGNVADVILGFNNSLPADVIQSVATL